MAINIVDATGLKLSQQATRGFIRFTLPGLLAEGLSGNKAMQVYRNAGYKFGDTWFWDTRRQVLGIEKDAHTIQKVGLQSIPDTRKFALAAWDLESEFMYTASYTEVDIDTGILSKRTYSWKTDLNVSPEELQDKMLEKLHQQYPMENLFRSNMRLIGAFRSG